MSDADISYKWRNDPEVWLYTEYVITTPISPEIEKNWLSEKLKLSNEKRFAICLSETNEYIGNIQIIGINNGSADFHLFIGEKKFWGKGIGYQASLLILKYAFFDLMLKNVFLEVHAENVAGFSIYKKVGFTKVSRHGNFIKMVVHSSALKIN